MDNLVFNVSERNEKGKKARMNGQIPCIIYGNELKESLPGEITKRELIRLLGCPKSSVISLKLNGAYKKCIVKEMQQDLFGKVIHIDFQSVSKGEVVKLKIPIVFIGQDVIEANGLLLESFVTEIELQGEPGTFPENISVDVSKLSQGNQLLVKDLNIPSNMVVETNEYLAVARVGYISNNIIEENV